MIPYQNEAEKKEDLVSHKHGNILLHEKQIKIKVLSPHVEPFHPESKECYDRIGINRKINGKKKD